MFIMSCHNANFRKSVTDNGNTLTIQVDVNNEKQAIHYKQSFDVMNMNNAEKKELEKHIYDSLGVRE